MDVFRRIFLVAGLAGLLAGILATLAHMAATVPLIQKAETYEAAAGHDPASSMEAVPHDHEEDGWQPADGLERASFTALADILTGIGFALLLVSAYVLRGTAIDWRQGLGWGLAGFASFSLAPGIGLPPEIPGMAAAPLLDRQVWWLATAVATAGGLALIVLPREKLWKAAGLVLLALPHLYGAPQPMAPHGAAPEALAHQFVIAALATSLLFWLALGGLTGFFFQRLAPVPPDRDGAALRQGVG